ncbi:MAG: GAF domain-containing protein [Anaerolineales bacterium]|nr:GAF domain-containing protein [Anaerolineales bacterium]
MSKLEESTTPQQETAPDKTAALRSRIQQLEAELASYKESGAQISRFANQLRTAADVSKQLSSILDLEQLLKKVVALLKERFRLYHVHVYLLDESQKVLRMVAGSGGVGELLRVRQHAISLDTVHSLVVRAAREGYIILVDDVSREPDFLPNPLLPDTRCEMAVPLITGNRVLGVLDVQDDRSHRFDQLDVATFSTFSGHIAAAIQNAYLFEEQRRAETAVRRYAERLQSLHEIDQAILTAESPDNIARTAIQRLKEIVPYHRASFSSFDYQSGIIHIFSVTGSLEPDAIDGDYSLAESQEILELVRQGPIVGNLADLPSNLPPLPALADYGVKSVLIYPLVAYKEIIGTLNFSRSTPDSFDEHDVQVVGEVAAPLAIAIEQARLYEQVKQHAQTLEEQNTELAQFAYVASHDLQEPLRIVISYVQLLERRYAGKLDEDADLFIHYIVDGALRMKNLINGLLDYSRLGRQNQSLAPTDCEAVLQQVLSNLHLTIQETNAIIHHDPLPTLMADSMQLTQLWQNLLSNALKFSETQPEIYIGAKRENQHWLFWVKDNGIGLEVEYGERIFAIFQRLHTLEEYPGTGIGLAICRKIVERHNGRIWVESEPGAGATFYFTLPVKG